MANIKWSGIESSKYGLTARWFVSGYYGNDFDVDGVGYYHPSTNVTGHGGPIRPFATEEKIQQDVNVAASAIVVYDSGLYYRAITLTKAIVMVGDGVVVFANTNQGNVTRSYYNVTLLSIAGTTNFTSKYQDCNIHYCTGLSSYNAGGGYINCFINESTFSSSNAEILKNCTLINCSSASTGLTGRCINSMIINCPNLYINTSIPRPSGFISDYSVIIGTVRSSRSINSKTTGIAIEDFKIDGNYFVKSYSEVDLFGNVSGSGASVAQLQTIFNNYFSPIYIDTYQFADLSLKPTSNERIRYGGLDGAYIGMRPVGYHFNAAALWANRNVGNTSNVEIDAVSGYLQIVTGAEYGTLETNEIDIGTPVIVDPVLFRANLVYNADGTAKQGVANQRIDTTVDLLPNNTLNQRVVYDYQMAYVADGVSALSAFKNFELNRKPTVDGELDSQLDDNYNAVAAASITVRRFKLRVVLRKIVID